MQNQLKYCVSFTFWNAKFGFDFRGEALITEDDLEEQAYVDYEAGCYSPKLLTQNELEIDSVVYEVADDIKKLELAREQVKTSGQVRVSVCYTSYSQKLVIKTE